MSSLAWSVKMATGAGEAAGGGVGGGDLSRRALALRVVTMPRDTNQYGTIFGGVILAYIDQAGFVQARRHGCHRWVTVAMDRVEFKQPVHLGDVVNFYARTARAGRSSVTVEVEVEAERYSSGQTVPVTTASLVMVSVDAGGRAIPFASAPTVVAEGGSGAGVGSGGGGPAGAG